jgi:hypothetical protein
VTDSLSREEMLLGEESYFARTLRECRWDLDRFASEVLGIDPHPGQQRFFNAVLSRDASRYKPAHLTIFVSAGNRAGKTLGLAIAVLHSVFYKIGLPQPDPTSRSSLTKWANAGYVAYHFAIQQETSEIVWEEIVKILNSTHEAQRRGGCPLTETLGMGVALTDKKYHGDYRWIQFSPVFGGGEIHFRTTGEKALGGLGKDMNLISYDECAFDPNLDFVFNEVLNMRRLSTSGQLILISTPTEGITAFADLWATGDPASIDRDPDRISLRMSTRDNVGYGIEPDMFDRIIGQVPLALVPQNIDGYFIEGREQFFATESIERSFRDDLPDLVPAVPKHRYAQGVDPAMTQDSTWSIMLDTTNPNRLVGVAATYRHGRQTADTLVAIASNQHFAYNRADIGCYCHTGIDSTGFGGKVFRSMLTGLSPLTSVEFGGRRSTKLRLLNNLRSALDNGRIVFPRSGVWLILRRQLLGYKLADRKLQQDAVMALAVALHIAGRMVGDNQKAPEFDFFGTTGRVPYERGNVVRLPLFDKG